MLKIVFGKVYHHSVLICFCSENVLVLVVNHLQVVRRLCWNRKCLVCKREQALGSYFVSEEEVGFYLLEADLI